MVRVFRNIGERSTAKNYHPVSFLYVVSKVFEKLVTKATLSSFSVKRETRKT